MIYGTAACFACLVNACHVLSLCVWAYFSAAEKVVIYPGKAPGVQFEDLEQIDDYLVV
jgi:hypothetical protein